MIILSKNIRTASEIFLAPLSVSVIKACYWTFSDHMIPVIKCTTKDEDTAGIYKSLQIVNHVNM